jgi:hypothetical protein
MKEAIEIESIIEKELVKFPMFDECVIVSIVQTCRGTNYSGLMKD